MADINLDELLTQFDQLADTLSVINGTYRTGSQSIGSLTAGARESAKVMQAEKEAREKAVKSLQESFGMLTGTIRGLTQGNTGFSSLNSMIDLTAKAAGGLTSGLLKLGQGIPVVGGALSSMADSAGAAAKMLADVAKVVSEQFDVGFRAFKDAARTGAVNSFVDLRESANKLAMRQEDLSSILASNSENLAQLGGNALKGTTIFAELANSSGNLRNQFNRLGTDAKEFSALQMGALAQFQKLGVSVKANDNVMRDYMENLQAVSNLTGKQKDELQKQENERMKQVNYRAAMARMEPARAASVSEMMKLLGASNPEMAKAVQEFISTGGLVRSKAGQESEIRSGGRERQMAMMMMSGEMTLEKLPTAIFETSKAVVEKQKQYGATLGEEHAYMKGGEDYFKSVEKGVQSVEAIRQQNKAIMEGTGEKNKENAAIADTSQKIYEMSAKLQHLATSATSVAKLLDAMTTAMSKLIGHISGGNGNTGTGMSTTKAVTLLAATAALAAAALARIASTRTSPGGWSDSGPSGSTAGKVGKFGKFANALGGVGMAATAGLAIGDLLYQAGTNEQGTGLIDRLFSPKGFNDADPSLSKSSSPTSGLRIKSAESTAGGETPADLAALAHRIQSTLGSDFNQFTAFNDTYHQKNSPGSRHTIGKALDFTINDPSKSAQIADLVRQMGVRYVKDEYKFPSANSTGNHIHVELMANGGITKGLSIAGEAGPEAVVPLPDGRTIPVNIGNWDQLAKIWSSIESKLDDLVSLTESGNNIQQKQLVYSRN